MTKPILIIHPSYKGKGYFIKGKNTHSIESFPGYIEELIERWLVNYKKMIDNIGDEIYPTRLAGVGKMIANELKEYIPEYQIEYSNENEIKDQIVVDLNNRARGFENRNDKRFLVYLKKRWGLDNDNVEFTIDLAIGYFNFKKYQEALNYFQLLLKKDPFNWKLVHLVALCEYLNGNYIIAKSYYEKLIAAEYYDENIVLSAAENYTALGMYTKASWILEKGVEMFPDNYDIIKDLAMNYNLDEDFENESQILLQIINTHSIKVNDVILLGNCYLKLNLFEKAVVLYKNAIANFPNEAELYYKLAFSYHTMNEELSAIDIYIKALVRDPNLTNCFWEKSKILLDLKIDNNLRISILNLGADLGDTKAQKYLDESKC